MDMQADDPALKHDYEQLTEWDARVQLAAAYRLVAHFGWDDLIFTHLSCRVPGPEHHFLLNPYGYLFHEITASSLVKVDKDGNAVDDDGKGRINPAGFTIHSAVHMARDDAHAVMHLHEPNCMAVSAQGGGLKPLSQTAMLCQAHLAFHEYEGVALELGKR
ncbi:class II aldolase/adducin family protein [Aquisalimonas lutea]|uniref:class II aldolase/adducin family protein n=1 Tax=Aquisalimonas lutea TaxID=1327750 RepID=UPI0025B434B4|nr:class II aldolase/adducin family protein [Aquisalimonas lutea]MDN3518792.1 class II aldolase/adducin family protein [Aquisalimonas lutea]